MKVLVSLFTYRPCFCLTLLVYATLLTGCSRSVVPATAVSAASVRATASSTAGRLSPEQAAIAQVQTMPLYQKAQAACKVRHFADAAGLLQQLVQQHGLNDAERAFVQQQRVLCLQDAGLPLPASPITPPGSLIVSTPSAVSSAAPSLANADCGPRALLLLCHHWA